MFQDVINEMFFQSIGRFLPWLRRKIYPKDKFVKDIEFDVKSSNPISFYLNSEIPYVALYLKIINKSQYLEMIIENMIFDVWIKSDIGFQPAIRQGKMVSHQRIGKKETKELFWETELNEYQTKFLKTIKDSKELSATVYIKYEIYSDIYEISDDVHLDNKPCKIKG